MGSDRRPWFLPEADQDAAYRAPEQDVVQVQPDLGSGGGAADQAADTSCARQSTAWRSAPARPVASIA
jgi:hypothetical protein